jgi:hypothetical protein
VAGAGSFRAGVPVEVAADWWPRRRCSSKPSVPATAARVNANVWRRPCGRSLPAAKFPVPRRPYRGRRLPRARAPGRRRRGVDCAIPVRGNGLPPSPTAACSRRVNTIGGQIGRWHDKHPDPDRYLRRLGLRDAKRGRRVEYSVGEAEPTAITVLTAAAWTPALGADGHVRDGAEVAELTGLLDLGGWPAGMRVIVRRERPHPGAQMSLFEERDGWRYTAFVTNTSVGQLQWLEARHRAHAGVEDPIPCAKTPAWAGYPPASSPSTTPGAPWRRSPPTSSPGSNSLPCKENWPQPNQNDCATASCAPPPA